MTRIFLILAPVLAPILALILAATPVLAQTGNWPTRTIKLVVPYTGDGISQTASDALQALLDDEDLDEERVAVLTEYGKTLDLATVEAAAEAAGISKPTSGQVQYIDLSGDDSVTLDKAEGSAALGGLLDHEGIYRTLAEEALQTVAQVVPPAHDALWGAAKLAEEAAGERA